MNRIIVLGITGSIGITTVKALKQWKQYFHLVAFSYHKGAKQAMQLQEEFGVKHVCCTDMHSPYVDREEWDCRGVELYNTLEDLLDVDYDKVVVATLGTSALQATHKATQQGKCILIANKESLVVAGSIIMSSARQHGSTIIPLDSEHNSVFRLLTSLETKQRAIDKIYLTASGGPLLNLSIKDIQSCTKQQVLQHPNWEMGHKITVDSAGLINKALEIIEAHHLFQLGFDQLDAIIHPKSYVHAIIRHQDGSFFFHASNPDMLYPIAYGLFYPKPPLNYHEENHTTSTEFPITTLPFQPIDHRQFPGYRLGIDAAKQGGVYPIIFNVANEELVYAFLAGTIHFTDIVKMIEIILNMDNLSKQSVDSIPEILYADLSIRQATRSYLGTMRQQST